MTRKANETPRDPNATSLRIRFEPHEFARLKHNPPGASGKIGGYQRHENWIVEHTDPNTLECELDPERQERTRRYIRNYGSGGPNGRIRAACIPALRRAGIDPLPEWRAT